jgi:hypothetical protein
MTSNPAEARLMSDTFYARASDTGFSVLTYAGADPTGAADSSAAVTAAYAAAVAAGGGYVTFGPGTWKFGTVSIPGVQHTYQYLGGNVHFRFAGPGVTVLTPVSANTPLFKVDTSSFPTAAGVRFEGGFSVQAHASGSTGPAIDLTGARQFVIESPSYFDSSKGLSGSPGTYAQVIGLGPNTYACRIVNPVCEGQKLGGSFIGSIDRATVIANGNTIVNPLFEANTAAYMIDAAGTGELNIYDGIIEGNTVTAAIRLGSKTRVRGMHFESNAAYAMDAAGVDNVNPGACWLESNVYNSGSGTLTIPSGVLTGTTIVGSLGSLAVSDATGSYLLLTGSQIAAGGGLSLATPLRHLPVTSGTTSGTVTLDPRNGDYQRIAPTANVTVGSTTGDQNDGQDLTVEVTQPASGGPWTVAWSSQFIFAGATTPAASTAAGTVDVFAFRWNGTASKWIERYRRLGYFTALQAANNLSDLASASTARTNLGLSGLNANDPMAIGFTTNYDITGSVSVAFTWPAANDALYTRLRSAGYAVSSVDIDVGTASGNISVGYYTTSGSGQGAAPKGAQLATSGAVACPAAGYAAVSVGSTVTPRLVDWIAISCDNTTAEFMQAANGMSTTLTQGLAALQTTAHPLPATPGTLTAVATRYALMSGS